MYAQALRSLPREDTPPPYYYYSYSLVLTPLYYGKCPVLVPDTLDSVSDFNSSLSSISECASLFKHDSLVLVKDMSVCVAGKGHRTFGGEEFIDFTVKLQPELSRFTIMACTGLE